jgi:hypothetical protein
MMNIPNKSRKQKDFLELQKISRQLREPDFNVDELEIPVIQKLPLSDVTYLVNSGKITKRFIKIKFRSKNIANALLLIEHPLTDIPDLILALERLRNSKYYDKRNDEYITHTIERIIRIDRREDYDFYLKEKYDIDTKGMPLSMIDEIFNQQF